MVRLLVMYLLLHTLTFPQVNGQAKKVDYMRLANGGSPCAGRVEIRHRGRWGTVYGGGSGNYGWDMEDAAVVCKELGCGAALSATTIAHFGEGSGPIVTYNVRCRGSEAALRDCQSGTWDHYSWPHSYDVGVICSGSKLPRLVNVSSRCAGRVELYTNDVWGTVCGNSFSRDMAGDICNLLGCGTASSVSGDAQFGEGLGPVIGWPHCGHESDSGIFCSEHRSSRLIGGTNSCSGRVELQQGDKLGTVCDYYWDIQDANVLCRQLGCGFALSTGPGGQYGEAKGLMWKTQFNCVGNESQVWNCSATYWEEFSCTHDHDVTVICSGKQWHLQLEDGGSRCDGRVEIYHDGTWGRLLDDSWNMSDGDVVCRQLNCGSAISVYNSSPYGEGTGPVWINNVQCVGTETHIWNCPRSTGNPFYYNNSDVGVLCSDHKQLRLVNGDSSCSGTVEIYHNGHWRRVRDQFWHLNDANVVCRQLACGPAITAYTSPMFTEGGRSPWVKDVQCQGNESHLLQCKPSRLNQSTGNTRDVRLQCSRDVQIRLMDGGSSCAGRVEIYYNGSWGTVCDDSWGSVEADVVCQQLGCGTAVTVTAAAPCGNASEPIWLDEVRCSGNESTLSDCASSPWGKHDCHHKEDVSIVCTEHKQLRLVNGRHSCEGRVEVFYNGTWGTVCMDSMDLKAAEVICRQLDCGKALEVDYFRKFAEGNGRIWLDDMECNSQERFLWQCSSPPWGEHNCRHSEDVGVICSENAMKKMDRVKRSDGRSQDPPNFLPGEKLRLVGGSNVCSGTVEISSNKTWGTVCDDSWDIREASVVCRQLGCGPAVRAVGQAGFGQGAGQIWPHQLHCRGSESFLWDCVSSAVEQTNCSHREDAGVVCSGSLPREATSRHSPFAHLINIPVITCIVLVFLLAIVLFALVVEMDSNSPGREEKHPSVRLYQAIYEEIEDLPIRRRSLGAGSFVSGSSDSINKLEYYTGDNVNGSDPELGNDKVFPPNGDDQFQEEYDDAESGALQQPSQGLLPLVTDTPDDDPTLTSHTDREPSLHQGGRCHTDSDPLDPDDVAQCNYDDVECDPDTDRLPNGTQRDSPQICSV